MKSQDSVKVEFVNNLIGRGILNNVINLTFGVFNFTPNSDNIIEADNVIAARLRMDVPCARQLRDALNDLIEQVDKEQSAMHQTKRISPDAETEGVVIKGTETSH